MLAVALKLPVLTPLQILYINLVTDGLPAISFAFSPQSDGVMKRQPQKIESILAISDFKHLLSIGGVMVLLLLMLVIPIMSTITPMVVVTILFTTMILVQHFALIDFWLSQKLIVKNFHVLKHPIFLLAFFMPIAIHPLLLYNPTLNRVFGTASLDLNQVMYTVTFSLGYLIFIETVKTFRLRKRMA